MNVDCSDLNGTLKINTICFEWYFLVAVASQGKWQDERLTAFLLAVA